MAKTSVGMTPAEINDKWVRRSKAATPDIIAGINRVSENPAAKAAAASKKWLNAVQGAENRFKSGLGKVTLEEWKAKSAEKTQARHGSGVDAGAPAQRAFVEAYIPVINSGLQKLASMPSMTLEDNINIATTFMRHLADNPYKK